MRRVLLFLCAVPLLGAVPAVESRIVLQTTVGTEVALARNVREEFGQTVAEVLVLDPGTDSGTKARRDASCGATAPWRVADPISKSFTWVVAPDGSTETLAGVPAARRVDPSVAAWAHGCVATLAAAEAAHPFLSVEVLDDLGRSLLSLRGLPRDRYVAHEFDSILPEAIRVVPRDATRPVSIEVQAELVLLCSDENESSYERGALGTVGWLPLTRQADRFVVPRIALEKGDGSLRRPHEPGCSPAIKVERYRVRQGDDVRFELELPKMMGC